jgi:hypothetical protein
VGTHAKADHALKKVALTQSALGTVIVQMDINVTMDLVEWEVGLMVVVLGIVIVLMAMNVRTENVTQEAMLTLASFRSY